MARVEAHSSVAKANVRGTLMRRHAAMRFRHGSLHTIAFADGWPRLWSFGLDAAAAGFREYLKGDDASGDDLLKLGLSAARGSLVHACNTLVERRVPDAHFCALQVLANQVRVSCSGNCRVYVHRGNRPKRITTRDIAAGGLLNSESLNYEHNIEPGDLILAGSESAFSTAAVSRVAAVIQDDPNTSAAVLAALLTEPARKAGMGAAAVAIRIR